MLKSKNRSKSKNKYVTKTVANRILAAQLLDGKDVEGFASANIDGSALQPNESNDLEGLPERDENSFFQPIDGNNFKGSAKSDTENALNVAIEIDDNSSNHPSDGRDVEGSAKSDTENPPNTAVEIDVNSEAQLIDENVLTEYKELEFKKCLARSSAKGFFSAFAHMCAQENISKKKYKPKTVKPSVREENNNSDDCWACGSMQWTDDESEVKEANSDSDDDSRQAGGKRRASSAAPAAAAKHPRIEKDHVPESRDMGDLNDITRLEVQKRANLFLHKDTLSKHFLAHTSATLLFHSANQLASDPAIGSRLSRILKQMGYYLYLTEVWVNQMQINNGNRATMLTAHTRSAAVNFLFKQTCEWKLTMGCFHHSVAIFDEFCNRQTVEDQRQLKVFCYTALYVAAKHSAQLDFAIEEDPSIRETGAQAIFDCESELMQENDFILRRPTALHFYDALTHEYFSKRKKICMLIQYLSSLSMMDYRLTAVMPSKLYGAALLLAVILMQTRGRVVKGFNFGAWTYQMHHRIPYTATQLQPLCLRIAEIALNASKAPYRRIYDWYTLKTCENNANLDILTGPLMKSIIAGETCNLSDDDLEELDKRQTDD